MQTVNNINNLDPMSASRISLPVSFSTLRKQMATLVVLAMVSLGGFLSGQTVPAGLDLVKSGSNYILIGPERQSIETSAGTFGSFSSVYDSSAGLILGLGTGGASDNMVVAVGSEGRILYSMNNGSSFNLASTPPLDGDLTAVAYGSNLWLAVGFSGFDAVVWRSSNGTTWTAWATIEGFNPTSITWTGGEWLVVGSDSFFDGQVFRSTNNGGNWIEMVLPPGTDPLLDVAANGSGVAIAVGEWGTILKRNSDSSGFFAVGEDLVSASLTSVAASSDGSFTAGGDETTFVTILGNNTVSVLGAPQPGTGAIEGLLIDGALLRFVGLQPGVLNTNYERVLAPEFDLAGSVLTVTLPTTTNGRTYRLRTAVDSTYWAIHETKVGDGGPLTFNLNIENAATFVQVEAQ